jgi:hypothetical protein
MLLAQLKPESLDGSASHVGASVAALIHMTQLDISRSLRETGVTLERLAEYAAVRVADLTEWQRRGEVPRKFARQVQWAIWAARRDVAIAQAGIPECDVLKALVARSDQPDLKEVTRHLNTCAICVARSKYLDEHLEPAPALGGSLLMRALPLVERLDGLPKSAAYGSLALLGMGGIGVPLLLVVGIARMDPTMVLGAFALFLVLVLTGAAGGVVHYYTRPMREAGSMGHYASSVLTVYGYLAAVFGIVALAALFGSDLHEMVTTRVGWIASAVIGAFIGLIFGHQTRD